METLDKMPTPYEMLEHVVEAQQKDIEELKAKDAARGTSAVVAKEAAPQYAEIPKATFEYKKETYKFLVSGIFHDGQRVLACDAVEKGAEMLKIFVETYPKTVEKINL